MKYILFKRPWPAILRPYLMWLFTTLFLGTTTAFALEETANAKGDVPYQSTFDDYRATSIDSLTDWKTINQSSDGGGHSGHQMQGMQHDMTPDQMANMPSNSKETPVMEGMDHSSMQGMEKAAPNDMKGMDHSQMKPDQTMKPMVGMDHSKMTGMDHGDMKSMPDSKSAIQPTKKDNMSEMNHEEMAGHDHGGSDMKAMDHSKMNDPKMGDTKPNDMQPSQESALNAEVRQDETQPHAHASTQASEHAGMSMPSMPAATEATPWQIIPNFHPIVVHFPIALTIVSFLLSFAAYVRRNHPDSSQLAAAGHFTLWLAAIGAATAVLFGWLAFNSITNHDDAGHAAMLLHRSWAIPTAVGLILLASWDALKYRVNELISVPMLLLLFLLSQAIAITGWLGGEVVYRHGVGVLSIPSSSNSGHVHNEGVVESAMPNQTASEHADKDNHKEGESHAH
ncbi:MAG: hypothetical protein BVN34_08520 [Proteobacteria bacterium ST_bin12]|nr:MAG: hypothetical protein BVN34_08520 [Proteobacteria bacterium ST_bin12]